MSDKTMKNIPKLRFPEFVNDGEWEEKKLSDLIYTITPPKKLLTNQYLDKGSFPIIDQSQKYIAGWTNDKESIIRGKLPLIIFGDHTCALKLINQPFAQGADGIKIFEANSQYLTTNYLYQFLQFNPLIMEEYKRHFSILRDKLVKYPNKNSGEQQKIADCLSSLDSLIIAQSQKVEFLKEHKKGLLQNLFPKDGESVPKYRFTVFRNDSEWEKHSLGDIGIFLRGLTYSSNDVSEDGLLVLRSSNIQDDQLVLNKDLVFVNKACSNELLLQNGDIVICMSNGSKALVGKSATYIGNYDDKVTIGAFCSLFRAKISLAKYIFQTNDYQKFVAISIGGGNINNLKNSDLELFPIYLPKAIEEQQKIADCLTSIDDEINLQIQKVKLLKEHKKSLLQKLFPSSEANI